MFNRSSLHLTSCKDLIDCRTNQPKKIWLLLEKQFTIISFFFFFTERLCDIQESRVKYVYANSKKIFEKVELLLLKKRTDIINN